MIEAWHMYSGLHMNKILKFLPVAALILTGGCSSRASVGNYLWGDNDTSAPTTAPVTNQASLAPSQSVSAYKYQPTTSPLEKRANFSSIPKNSQRVYVVVNDQPITGRDISQRMRLNRVLGRRGSASRKAATRELIDDIIQIDEAKRNKVNIDDRRIDGAIKGMAGNSPGGTASLKARLLKQGISWSSLRDQVKASLALRWLMQKKGAKVGTVDEAEVDRRLAKINSDPRRQAVTVYMLRQVTLPVEQTGSAMGAQLLQARAIEAQQIARHYRGCSSLRRASSSIYNVKLSRIIQADGRKLPPQMKKALRRAGRKKLIGPMRVRQGIQMIAYCGTKRITPPKVGRAQIKAMVRNEKFGKAADRVLRELRSKAFIDYKVASSRP